MQPDLPTNTQALGCWIGKSQAFGLIAAKRRSATRPLAGPLFGETKPISPCSASRAPAPTRLTKRTQFRLRRQPLASPKSATSSYSLALGQLRRTNPIPPFRHSPPAAPRLTERSQFQRIRPPREKLTAALICAAFRDPGQFSSFHAPVVSRRALLRWRRSSPLQIFTILLR